jgi:hypothetical protein
MGSKIKALEITMTGDRKTISHPMSTLNTYCSCGMNNANTELTPQRKRRLLADQIRIVNDQSSRIKV